MLIVTYCLPGALAKAVISTIEAIGTWPTIANKGAQALRREQGSAGSALFEGRAEEEGDGQAG